MSEDDKKIDYLEVDDGIPDRIMFAYLFKT